MIKLLRIVLASVVSAFRTRRDLALENLALRQQLALFKQTGRRPQLSDADRAFWVVLSRMVRRRNPPSQTWRTFLDNHVTDLVSMDFLVVPTATFRVLFVLVILAHDRRRIVHLNVTEHPTSAWTAQQLREAFPWDNAPRCLLRNRDGVYGAMFRATAAGLGIEEVLTAPRSPWQSPYAERLVGTLRRELLDHVVVLGGWHLRRILARYAKYYADDRTHLAPGKDSPEERAVEGPGLGEVIQLPRAGGLHHRYCRRAA